MSIHKQKGPWLLRFAEKTRAVADACSLVAKTRFDEVRNGVDKGDASMVNALPRIEDLDRNATTILEVADENVGAVGGKKNLPTEQPSAESSMKP